MTGGAELSAREREGERARGQVARMGRVARPRGRERARARAHSSSAVRLGRADGRKEEAARSEFLFFFLKI
jgi:hypothetical protein